MLGLNRVLTADQRVYKAQMALNSHRTWVPFIGIRMIGSVTIVESLPPYHTASTNGRDVILCRAFVDSLTDAGLRFLLLHEDHHKALEDLSTWQHLNKICPTTTNAACDHVNNIWIFDLDNGEGFVTMPVDAEGNPIGLMDFRFRGMDVQQVFNILYKEQEGPEGEGPEGEGPEGEGPEGEGEGEGEGKGKGKGKGKGQGQGQGQGGFDHHDWEGAGGLSDEEQQELGVQIRQALREGAIAAGKMSGSGAEDTFDKMLTPQVDWREVLRDFISSTCAGHDLSTYARPNRRYLSTGVYMPSGISERVDHLVLAVDTSGSISQAALSTALAEVKGICDTVCPAKVTLIYWGWGVVRVETYDEYNLDTLVDSTKPEDGGGTDVNCVPAYLRDNHIDAQAVVVFTDGYLGADWGKWDWPVLWGIFNNTGAVPDVGKTTHIDTRR